MIASIRRNHENLARLTLALAILVIQSACSSNPDHAKIHENPTLNVALPLTSSSPQTFFDVAVRSSTSPIVIDILNTDHESRIPYRAQGISYDLEGLFLFLKSKGVAREPNRGKRKFVSNQEVIIRCDKNAQVDLFTRCSFAVCFGRCRDWESTLCNDQ